MCVFLCMTVKCGVLLGEEHKLQVFENMCMACSLLFNTCGIRHAQHFPRCSVNMSHTNTTPRESSLMQTIINWCSHTWNMKQIPPAVEAALIIRQTPIIQKIWLQRIFTRCVLSKNNDTHHKCMRCSTFPVTMIYWSCNIK